MIRMDFNFSAGFESNRPVFAENSHLRIVADEGVSAPTLGVFHTFQDIAVRADMLDRSQDFNGRTTVGIQADADRNDLILILVGFYLF